MRPNDTTKVCRKCGEDKPLDAFGKNRSTPDGLQGWCRACRKARADNPERKAKKVGYDRQRRIDRVDEFRAYNHDRYHNNPNYRDRELGRARARRADPEFRERQRERHYRRWADPEYRRKKTARLRYRRHHDPEYRRKVWHWRQVRRARIKDQGVPFTEAEWIAVCRQHDFRCLACGQQRPLTVDHIVPISRGGSSDISNVQPLCLDCNRQKHARTIDFRFLTQTSLWDGGGA